VAVKIRLKRIGAKSNPIYRIVAIDSRKRRDSRPIEVLGYYNPFRESETQIKKEAVDLWIKKGASVSRTVNGIINKAVKKIDSSLEEHADESFPETESTQEKTDEADSANE